MLKTKPLSTFDEVNLFFDQAADRLDVWCEVTGWSSEGPFRSRVRQEAVEESLRQAPGFLGRFAPAE